MPQLTLHLKACAQVEHTINTGDDAASYRVMFAITPPTGNVVPDCSCDVKCAAGAKFTDPGALEVGRPLRGDGTEYRGAWNHHEFSNVIAQYLPHAFNRMINVGPGARNIAMMNNLISVPARGIINVPATPLGGIW